MIWIMAGEVGVIVETNLSIRGAAELWLLVLQKDKKLHPKVRNHGEGPY